MACAWLGNTWVCVCWMTQADGELRGLVLIVFFAALVDKLGHVIPWFLEGC